MKIIDEKKYEELQLNAKLHGMKLKERASSLDLSSQERQESTELANDVFERMKVESQLRKVNDGQGRVTNTD